MPYIEAQDRNQMMMCSLDSMVDPESIARIIDRFVDGLDLEGMGFSKAEAAAEGRPAYDPRCLLKLYLYGSRKKLRSSRRLEEACHLNVEVRWLMSGLEPDFRTISDFRKDNAECLKKVFHEFNHKLSEALAKGFLCVDGSKFQANNSKDNNFTANKLDDRIEWLDRHTDEYLRQLADMDEAEEETQPGQITREELERKLKEAGERLERYKAYRDYMEEKGLSQISLTDPEAKLMKSKNGFMVAYNVQTAVDSETHMIEDYVVTDHVTDHGLLEQSVAGIKGNTGEAVIQVVADKGYNEAEDMASCLESGIIPNVILPDGKDTYELEIPYEDPRNGIDDAAEKTGRIKRSLRAGIIPEGYEGMIESIEVVEKKVLIREEPRGGAQDPYGSAEEMKERAGEGYFVRDPERNLVYCPAGEILRQKSIKKNGNIRYANKTACRHCKNRNKCYKGKNEWKEIDFNKDTLEKPCQDWLGAEGKDVRPDKKTKRGHYEIKKIVRLVFRPDRQKMSQRLCISEHPFGTIKRWMDAGYYLLRGKRKVEGETALMCLGYNLIRAMNLLGFQKLIEVIA